MTATDLREQIRHATTLAAIVVGGATAAGGYVASRPPPAWEWLWLAGLALGAAGIVVVGAALYPAVPPRHDRRTDVVRHAWDILTAARAGTLRAALAADDPAAAEDELKVLAGAACRKFLLIRIGELALAAAGLTCVLALAGGAP